MQNTISMRHDLTDKNSHHIQAQGHTQKAVKEIP